MNLKHTRDELFNSEFVPITDDKSKILEFCDYISKLTGVQCCTANGRLYECLPHVYESALNYEENTNL